MAQECAWVCGVGMMTAVGDCAPQTVNSVRAGISRYEESSIYNKRFIPMTMALLPEENIPPLHEALEGVMPGLTSRQRRMLRLTGPALSEALTSLPPTAKPAPLLLAVPEPMPNLTDRPPPVSEKFLDHLITQCETDRIVRNQSKLFPTGRTSGIEAVDAAITLLQTEQHDYVLVGGVDSYLDLYLLGTLDAENRVKVDGAMDAFAPGEGAGFVLLCSDKTRESHSPKPTVKLHKPGTAPEPGHRYSDEPYKGDGLAQAVTAALENALDGQQVRTVLCSMNGENYGSKEWGVATLRNVASFDEALQIEHPAECFGDLGAAFAPVLLGIAATGLNQGYIAGPCLVWCSSEGENRAAICVTSEQ